MVDQLWMVQKNQHPVTKTVGDPLALVYTFCTVSGQPSKALAKLKNIPEPDHLYDYHISLAGWTWNYRGQ